MSIFGTIMDKIFHYAQATPTPTPALTPHAAAPAAAPAATASAPAAPASAPAAAAPPTAPATPQPVDVAAVLTRIAAEKGRPSNWQTSIVDLLTLLDMDPSLSARKELANELNIHVGADGTPEENIGLHKAVMTKLAENGGKVPADLRG